MMVNRRGRRHGTRSVRRALLGASLALSARGAFAATPDTGNANFAASSASPATAGDLFVNGATLDCSDLYVEISSGKLDGFTAGAAGATANPVTHVKGLLTNAASLTGGNNNDEPADITECVVAAGAYLHTAATAATAAGMEALVVKQVPANHFAVGGVAADTSTGTDTWDGSAALSGSATAGVTACPYAGTSAAGSSAQSDCTPDCSTTNADSGAEALAGTCFCSAGTYSSGTISGGQPDDASNSNAAAAASGCTKCSTTFAKADASMITSGFASTAWTECKVKAGYYITSPTGLVNGQITVAPAPAGTFQPQAVQLTGSGRKDTVLMTCPANSNSVAGSAECTCDDGYIVVSTLGGSECQATSAAAASPTADSAGASTPIAVALAAAAAVPLLL